MEESEVIFAVKPGRERLKAVIKLVESKYRSVKMEQEAILFKSIEEGAWSEDKLVLTENSGTKSKLIFSKLPWNTLHIKAKMPFWKFLTTQKPWKPWPLQLRKWPLRQDRNLAA